MKHMNYYRRADGGWDLRTEDEPAGDFSTTTPVLEIQRPDGGTTYRTIFEPPGEGETEADWNMRHANNPFKGEWTPVEIEHMPRMRTKMAAKIQNLRGDQLRALRDREDLGEDVTVERGALRAIDPEAVVEGAADPNDLRARWPAALERRREPR